MKKVLSKFKASIKNFIWRFRNKYYLFKKWSGSKISKLWHKITRKDQRVESRKIKNQQLRKELNISDDIIDLTYDVDLEIYRADILEENKVLENSLKVAKSSQDQDEIQSLNDKINKNKAILKLFPKSRKQQLKIESKKKELGGMAKGLLYLAPVLILLAVFSFYPILNAFRLVFIDEATGAFTLYGNFATVISDANFVIPAGHTGSSAMINTLVIVVFTVPVSIIISLVIAILLYSIKPLRNLFQTIFFLPYVTNSLAVGLVFAYMFKTDGGLINQMLLAFNIRGGSWVGTGASYFKAMFVLVLFEVWNSLAFKILVFLSAIQGIDKQYYQAALIDATPKYKQFRRITVPLISPTILYVVITSVIGAFKTYSSVIALFGNTGQPAGASYNLKTIVFYIYDFIPVLGKTSQAAAASVILFGIILLLTVVQMRFSKKRVHY